jgi:hypothetical protein
MCYDPDVSTIVTEHHLQEAEKMRKQGNNQKARRYLDKHNISKDDITFKYSRLKDVMKSHA